MTIGNKTYIVLFSDGTFGVFNKKKAREGFGKNPRQFECSDSLPIVELLEWQAKGYIHSKIKEVGFYFRG